MIHSEKNSKVEENAEAGVRIANTELQIRFCGTQTHVKRKHILFLKAYLNIFEKQLVRPFEFQAVDTRIHKNDRHREVIFASVEAIKELR